jgi:hypothetical protein
MRRLFALAPVLAVLLGPADAAAAPSARALAERCADGPVERSLGARHHAEVRRVARCVVVALRAAERGRPATRSSGRLDAAARRGLGVAVRLRATTPREQEAARARVNREVLDGARRACPGRVAVRSAFTDTSTDGMARTPLGIARFLVGVAGREGAAALLHRDTRIAVVTRRGRVLAGGRRDAAALLVAGLRCGR